MAVPARSSAPETLAALHGRLIRQGPEAFRGLDAGNRRRCWSYHILRRAKIDPEFVATGQQAEVLIPDQIESHHLLGIAVSDDSPV